MAVDIVDLCAAASANQGSQNLAVVLSVVFSLYTVCAITLSALTIYSTSQTTSLAGARIDSVDSVVGASVDSVSLVGLRRP